LTAVVSSKQERIMSEIVGAERRRENLIQELTLVEADLENSSSQIAIYSHLAEVSEKLEQLHELGAGELFWEDKYTNESDLIEHLHGLRDKAKKFNGKTDGISERKAALEKKIENSSYEIGYLKQDLEIVKQIEADSKNDFVIEREYEPRPFHAVVMPWSNKGEDEKRFRKYLFLAFLYSILFILIIPYIELPVPDKDEVVEVPERIAKFIKKKQPKPKEKKQTQLTEKKKPSEEEKVKARKKAAKTGLLAFKNNFADLMDDVSEAKLGANAKLSNQVAVAKSTTR